MLNKLFGTFGTRILCVAISFGLVIINARCFGAEGVGNISLFVLAISILQILTSLFGGGSLVYMLPKNDQFQIVLISYFSSLIINIIGSYFFLLFGSVPQQFALQLYLSTIFLSIFNTHCQLLLSKEKIGLYNFFTLLQVILLAVFLLLFLYFDDARNTKSYINAYLFSFLIVSVASFSSALKGIRFTGFQNIGKLIVRLFKYGITIQLANLSQLLNYRLGYYFIELSVGRAPLGIFDIGTKLSEAVWILPKSISSVQYARISNCKDNKEYAKKITLSFVKLSLVFTLLALLVLLCLPNCCFTFVFGAEFDQIKPILCVLSLGIFVFAANIILSHYFSGFGKFAVNTTASIIGLIITAGLGFAFFPLLKTLPFMQTLLIVAGINTLSYCFSFGYTFIRFKKDSKIKIKDLVVTKNDFLFFFEEVKHAFMKKRHDNRK